MQIVDAAQAPDSETFGAPPVDVTPLYDSSTAWRTIGLAQEERIRPRDGLVIPTVVVTFIVPPFPGSYTIRIDNYAFTHADVRGYMDERAYLIRGLWAVPDQLPPFVPAMSSTQPVSAAVAADLQAAALAGLPGVVP